MTGFTAPKILWLRNHEPRHFEKTAQGAAAQGRDPPPPDRRVRHRSERRQRHAAVGRGPARRGRRSCSRRWSWTSTCWPVLRVGGSDRQADARGGRSCWAFRPTAWWWAGRATAPPGPWATASSSKGVLSTSIGTSGVMFVHSDEVKIDPAGPRPHLLPRGPRQVAHDGREPLGRRLAAVVPQRAVQGRRGRRPNAPRREVYDLLTDGGRGGAGRAARGCSSCPISPASARRTPIPTPAAASSA